MAFSISRLTAIFSVALLPALASGQDLPVAPLVDALLPERAGPVIQNAPAELTRGIKPQEPIPAAFDLPKAKITVEFDGETHRLTDKGMLSLRSAAAVINDPKLASSTFQIGSHAYLPNNLAGSQVLTMRRAQAIVTHLHVFYGIANERLVPVGYGSSAPYDVGQPGHPLNQRIEVINISPLNQ